MGLIRLEVFGLMWVGLYKTLGEALEELLIGSRGDMGMDMGMGMLDMDSRI